MENTTTIPSAPESSTPDSVLPTSIPVDDMYAEKYVPLLYTGTLESAQQCHRHLWDFLARTGCIYKPLIQKVTVSCYACEYAMSKIKDTDRPIFRCKYCPIWGPASPAECNLKEYNSLYYQWTQCEDLEERKSLAAQIRDLPFTDIPVEYDVK